MEPVTHFLTGACISRAGLNRKTGYATLMLTLAAEFPDMDFVTYFVGPVTGLKYHRGLTHSFVGTLFDAAVVLGVVYLVHLWRRRRGLTTKIPPRWGLLYWYGVLGGLSHILLDFTNNYGVRPFSPFYHHWYSWDIVFIVEPLLLAALLLALILPWLFGLVSSEIGERRPAFRGRGWAIAALIFMGTLYGVRDHYHRVATTALDSIDYGGEPAKRVAAMPYAINPFHWSGVVETSNAYRLIDITEQDGEARLSDEDRHIFFKPQETPQSLAAKKSYLGRVYLDWAQFPLVETEPPDQSGDTLVIFQDMRFGYGLLSSPGRRPLSARVLIDRNLQVSEMWMGSNRQR